MKFLKKNIVILTAILGLLSQTAYTMGKNPESIEPRAPTPASQTPAYNNPYDPKHTEKSAVHQKNDPDIVTPVPTSSSPYAPFGDPEVQGPTGVMPTPGSPGTASSPHTSGGPAVRSISK